MKLNHISEHVWVSSYDDDLGRPALGLIVAGDHSIAIDAGYSKTHVSDFYDAIKKENLPLPQYTILTHWHWDHSFAVHAIHGSCIAERRTYQILKNKSKDDAYLNTLHKENEHFQNEYKDSPVIITLPTITFDDALDLNLSDLHIHAMHVTSPHTDDCTCIYVEEDKVLFVGDCICGVYPTWEVDIDKNNILIDTLKNIEFDIAIGGHWNPYTKEKLLDDLKQLRIK